MSSFSAKASFSFGIWKQLFFGLQRNTLTWGVETVLPCIFKKYTSLRFSPGTPGSMLPFLGVNTPQPISLLPFSGHICLQLCVSQKIHRQWNSEASSSAADSHKSKHAPLKKTFYGLLAQQTFLFHPPLLWFHFVRHCYPSTQTMSCGLHSSVMTFFLHLHPLPCFINLTFFFLIKFVS